MLQRIIIIITLSLLAYSCTTVPSRFSHDGSGSDSGYRVENETEQGFSLEVFYVTYSFFPNPDPAVQEAKAYFIRVASEIAKRKGKTIIRPMSTDLHASPTRNIISAQ